MNEVMNPYTFVPFGKQPMRTRMADVYRDGAGLLTGWLDVKLETKSRTIIPDGTTITGGDKEHKTMKFFRLPDGTPAIPGSELRGMLRSVYEAASNSCVPFLLDDKQNSMRVPVYAALKSRGLLMLKNGSWSLWDVDDEKEKTNKYQVQSGAYLGHVPGYFDPQRKAWLQFSVPIGNQYSIHYLKPKGAAPLCSWQDDEPFNALINELTKKDLTDRHIQRKDLAIPGDDRNAAHRGLLTSALRVKDSGTGAIPVWYQEVSVPGKRDKVYYISPSSIGRINQVKHWSDIMMDYNPCTCKDRLCPACMLFGNVVGDMGVRSRLRFTDALPVGGALKQNTDTITLPILSGPKPTAYEFYLKRPGGRTPAVFWNYDVFSTISSTRNPRTGKFEEKPVYEPNTELSPRGRKFYWHGVEQTSTERTGQNCTAEAIRANEAFTFRVYFDQITEKQLKELQWVITLGENATSSTMQHKLGHGRPVGYGSVKLTISEQSLRSLHMENGKISYQVKNSTLENQILCPFAKSEAVEALVAVADTQSVAGRVVAYPEEIDGKNGPTIYKWFANERGKARGLGIVELPDPVSLKGIQQMMSPRVRANPGQRVDQPRKPNYTGEASTSAVVEQPIAKVELVQGRIKQIITPKQVCLVVARNGKEYKVQLNGKFKSAGQNIVFNASDDGTGILIG